MVFNVVVEAVICHLLAAVVLMKAESEGIGERIQELAVFSYADDEFVVSPRTEKLHRVSNVLAKIFYRVGLSTNVRKTVSMACQTCFIPGGLSELEYTWQVTGIGPSYQ